ncbi:MAG TPA: glycosyltransferase family 39 protein, partial [Blastocatellia bacterium]
MKPSLINSLQSAVRNPQSAIIILFLAMIAATWQRWTQPLIDHGREMNLPARVLAGERIYSDIQVLYGPFAPSFNALLYGIFGIHLSVLKAAGAVCAILILLMIYRLARELMSGWESFLAAGLALVLCALKSTANYIQPYAYAALYGLVFALGSLAAIVSYIRLRANSRLVLAGALAGLSLISKPEIALAGLAAGLAALIVESVAERRIPWSGAAAFSAPVAVIAAATYGIVLSRTPLRVLLEDNHVLFTSMPPQLIYFNRHISGIAQWPSSLWFSLAG